MPKYANNNGNGNAKVRTPAAPGWMVTYGDIMSLLLTFFVLLISYSTIKEEAFRRALSSFQEALGMLPSERSVIMFKDVPSVRFSPVIPPHEIITRLRHSVYSAGLKDTMKITQEKEGIRITIQSPILFDSGKADLRPESSPVMDELIDILRQTDYTVIVEGHTDNVPIHTAEFPSNWELSTARAISVARRLFQQGNLQAGRFTVAGYGEFHSVATNDTPEGRQENRRVEILLRNVGPSQAEGGNVQWENEGPQNVLERPVNRRSGPQSAVSSP